MDIQIEKPTVTDEGSYYAGKSDAGNCKVLTRRMIRRLRLDADYWQGFHEERNQKQIFERLGTTTLEDPTRAGGWLFKP